MPRDASRTGNVPVSVEHRVRAAQIRGAREDVRTRASNQGLETKPNRVGVGPGSGGRPGVPQEVLVDVEGLLHTYNYAIPVWLNRPYRKDHM